jgi:hypothetical protein
VTGRYRQWAVAKWDRDPFRSLPPLQRYIYLALHLGPYSVSVPGVSVCGTAALAEVAGNVPDFAMHLDAMVSARAVRYEGRLFVLPDVLADAEPENPNQVKAWRKGFNELPAGPLKDEVDALMRRVLIEHGNARPVSFKDGRPDDRCAYIHAWDQTFVERSAKVPPTLVEGSADVPATSAEPFTEAPRTFRDGVANVPATLAELEEGEEAGAEAGRGTGAETETHIGKRGGAGGEEPVSQRRSRWTGICTCGTLVTEDSKGQRWNQDGTKHHHVTATSTDVAANDIHF